MQNNVCVQLSLQNTETHSLDPLIYIMLGKLKTQTTLCWVGSQLWVNLDGINGELRVELLLPDSDTALPGYRSERGSLSRLLPFNFSLRTNQPRHRLRPPYYYGTLEERKFALSYSLNESIPLSVNRVATQVVEIESHRRFQHMFPCDSSMHQDWKEHRPGAAPTVRSPGTTTTGWAGIVLRRCAQELVHVLVSKWLSPSNLWVVFYIMEARLYSFEFRDGE